MESLTRDAAGADHSGFTAAGLCSHGHTAGRLFRFSSSAVPVEKCLRHAAIHRPLMRTALATAAVVGTILTAINQGNVLLDGRFPAELWWKIPLTYSVPFMVSTWAALRIPLVRAVASRVD